MSRTRSRALPVTSALSSVTTLVAPDSVNLTEEEILRRRISELESRLTQAELSAVTAPAARAPRVKGAADYRRDVDLAIIEAAGKLVTEMVPEPLRGQVARLVANQLHHLSTPALGWPSEVLPTPERSDWR